MNKILLLIFLFLIACSQNSNNRDINNMFDASFKADLQKLEKARIFFGHQSVGANIIDGFHEILKKTGNNDINIIKLTKNDSLPNSFIAHTTVGSNREPITKCNEFSGRIMKDLANKLDIAVLKFCYVDMVAQGDPNHLFEYYKANIDSIKLMFPKLKIIHVTIPLTGFQPGWKGFVKKLIGKDTGYEDNVKRHLYNQLLRDYYQNEYIFDLAQIESTYLDGSRETFQLNEQTYFALITDYTYDGGHLNELGRIIVAKEFIQTLARVLETPGSM